MSANETQRQAQGTILASLVEHYRTWCLVIDCGRCGPRAVPMQRFPVDATVLRLLMRLRCHACGGRVETATLDNARPGWRRRQVRIWGPGSYG